MPSVVFNDRQLLARVAVAATAVYHPAPDALVGLYVVFEIFEDVYVDVVRRINNIPTVYVVNGKRELVRMTFSSELTKFYVERENRMVQLTYHNLKMVLMMYNEPIYVKVEYLDHADSDTGGVVTIAGVDGTAGDTGCHVFADLDSKRIIIADRNNFIMQSILAFDNHDIAIDNLVVEGVLAWPHEAGAKLMTLRVAFNAFPLANGQSMRGMLYERLLAGEANVLAVAAAA